MSSPNADIIAVSLSCPKNPKNPYRMGPPRACSVRNLFDERYCNSGPIKLWHFWHLLIYTKPGLIVCNYHPPLLILGLVCLFGEYYLG